MRSPVRGIALFLSLFFLLPAAGQTIVRAKRLPNRTVRALARTIDGTPVARERRHDERTDVREAAFAVRAGATLPAPVTASAAPPRIARSFLSDTSKISTPADASGAVGPLHVVTATNAGVVIHKRSGEEIVRLTQSQFWRASEPADIYYDPRIAYDAQADRWVAVALREANDLMIAATATGDPAGIWYRYRLPIIHIDFTRLALTSDTIVTATRLNGGESQSFYSIDKSRLYAGPATLVFRQYDNVDVSAVPADAPMSPIEYLVRGAAEAFLVKRLDRPDAPWLELRMPRKSLSFFAPPAPQADTPKRLDTGYDDVYGAVLRHSTMYATRVMVLDGPIGQRTSIAWAQFDPETGAGLRYGEVDDPTGRNFYAYPSLAVTRGGNMLIAYSAFSPTRYPSAEYIYVDDHGDVSSPAPVRNGEAPVLESERWGDYTTTVADPLIEGDFWTIQLYATPDNTWGAVWANVSVPPGKRRSVR